MTTTMVHIRVDKQIKINAARTLASMGLSMSDAVRMMLIRIATENALPFDVRVPNDKTIMAMNELEEGGGKNFNNIEDLMADLNADD